MELAFEYYIFGRVAFMIQFNPLTKLILADVDETVADVYTQATPDMIDKLNLLLEGGKSIFFVSGGGLQSICERITDLLEPELRQRILIAHCSGAEVWGFEPRGEIKSRPYYSLYQGCFTEEQKSSWRQITSTLIEQFHLKTFPTQPKDSFVQASKGDPFSIILADRGPQITFEFINSIDLTLDQKKFIEKLAKTQILPHHESYDLRYAVMQEAIKLYKKSDLPVHPHFGGTFALDHIINGVNKTKAVTYVLNNEQILSSIGLSLDDIMSEDKIEIWGDKYSQKKGGPDFQMCLAVSPKVRALDFRLENPSEIPKGYNIQIWDGKKQLHDGLLEYLQHRLKV